MAGTKDGRSRSGDEQRTAAARTGQDPGVETTNGGTGDGQRRDDVQYNTEEGEGGKGSLGG